ncbi:MAG: carboxylating nicotinate-nucleotide diphosphorylase [Clostridia bacterium]|jgi:nicotinate-nucleotide pyrophosphorylase (carboxylating)|nr:carboxylating nicotinate-nucleotide diphosphorylase [Clostridia bacterium]MDH7574069.1 carboxylating nicotinate-nucleotide diphosphorylase [Clostridia bacterium]
MLNLLAVRETVRRALEEDLGSGDLTTSLLFTPADRGEGEILAREEGVVAGLPVAESAFRLLSPDCRLEPRVEEGERVLAGAVVARVEGPLPAVLGAERVALNFLGRLSGIATLTSRYVERVRGYKARICDTRKTLPGMRLLDKYAVAVGGGTNHRFTLGEAVLLKDNHLKAAGGIAQAVARVRRSLPVTAKIEVEVENLAEVEEALAAGVDLIMLDNFALPDLRRAVHRIAGRALIEASGGINLETVAEVAAAGVDYISVGALTHSVRSLDLSLELL